MAGFDPDAYLAQPQAPTSTPAFDPDAYLASQPSAPTVAGEVTKAAQRGPIAGIDTARAIVMGPVGMAEKFGYQPVAGIANYFKPDVLPSHLLPNVSDALSKIAPGYEQSIAPDPNATAGPRYAGAVTEAVTNPTSYVGPGGPALKLAGAVLGGAGGQAGEDIGGLIGPGSAKIGGIIGALIGGAAAAKTVGPKQAVAATPTRPELRAEYKADYAAARDSGLKVDSQLIKNFGTEAEQQLINEGHDSEKITKFVQNLQNPPEGSTVTAQNLDGIRKYLGNVSRQTQDAGAGRVKPTPDAAAASAVLSRFKDLTENIPESSVVAGNADTYAQAIKRGNANFAAHERASMADFRLSKAENAADRNVAGSVANQIRTKVGGLLDNPSALRGMTDAEKAQIKLINSSGIGGQILRQWGRGGAAHVIPIGMQLAATAKTGGLNLPVWASMVGARLGDNALTKARAQKLVDMLAQRSPLYADRLKMLSTTSRLPHDMQILRSGAQQFYR